MHRPGMLRWALIGRVLAAAVGGDVDAARRHRTELDSLGSHPASIFDGQLQHADAAVLRAEGRVDEARMVLETRAAEVASLGDCTTEAACLHDLVRLGRPQQVQERLAQLAENMDGRWVGVFSSHTSAAATDDAGKLGEVSRQFEEMGALAFAVEAAQEAADAHARRSDQRAATRWTHRAAEVLASVTRCSPVGAGSRGCRSAHTT